MTTGITWTDHTINPGIYGCTKISPACTNCYAMGMAGRLEAMGLDRYAGTTEGGQWTGRVRVDFDAIGPAFAKLPKRTPARVFVTSMSDLFHHDVPAEFIGRVFWEMNNRPHLTFQVLTKRAERMASWSAGFAPWPRNVWAGVTVEDQRRADDRIPHLLRVPAAARFLSVEPMLSEVDLWTARYPWPDGGAGKGSAFAWGRDVSWVICGGESGPDARPMHPDWARSLRDQCQAAGVPFFFKQWGEWAPIPPDRGGVVRWVDADGTVRTGGPQGSAAAMTCCGRKRSGRLLDGRTWDEMLEDRVKHEEVDDAE